MADGNKLEGPLYNDTMCLISSGEPGDTNNSRLCVKNSPLILAPIPTTDNTFQGVLGLSKGEVPELNYVKLL